MLPSIATPGFTFLAKASKFYNDICPEQSRFLMRRHQSLKASGSLKRLESTAVEGEICPFCFQWRRPGNHRVRLRAKRRASARVQRVLRREGRGKRLSLMQSDLLQRFRKAPAVLMATCHTCNHTARYNGANRDLMATISRTHGTPGSARKRMTPRSPNPSNMSTPKTPKNKTVFSTARSNSKDAAGSTSSASSSSTPASAKKSPFARLRSFLMLEDRQKTKKAGLKDFLSSL